MPGNLFGWGHNAKTTVRPKNCSSTVFSPQGIKKNSILTFKPDRGRLTQKVSYVSVITRQARETSSLLGHGKVARHCWAIYLWLERHFATPYTMFRRLLNWKNTGMCMANHVRPRLFLSFHTHRHHPYNTFDRWHTCISFIAMKTFQLRQTDLCTAIWMYCYVGYTEHLR